MPRPIRILCDLLAACALLPFLVGLAPAEAAKNAVPHAHTAKTTAHKPVAKPNTRRPAPARPASAPTDRGDAHWRHQGVG